MKRVLICTILFCLPAVSYQEATEKLEFLLLSPEAVQHRLRRVTVKLSERRKTLEAMFRESGCDGDRLTTQPVPRSPQPNLICTLPGEGPGTIVIGGHFDLAERGSGAVDNWSGSSLLPSLYQSLAGKPRRHTLVFIAFAAEEKGLWGSTEYVKKLPADERATIRGMVNLDCLGLTPPKVWASRADKTLLELYVQAAHAIQLEAVGMNVDNVGDDDSHSFVRAKIPTISFHSLTQETFPILHSFRDELKAIQPEHYYTAYRLVATYLAYLDMRLN